MLCQILSVALYRARFREAIKILFKLR